jgi:glycosyltransferase 2 family protein
MGRGAAKLAIKCVITALLLWLAFRTVDVRAVSTLLLGLNWWWAAAALLLTGVLIVSDAMLLCAVMRIFDRRVRFGTAFLYSLVGWFFSNVAPSTVGGDIFRGVQLSRVGTPVATAVKVILSIRLLSLATLVVVMFAGFPVAVALVEDRRDILLLTGTLGVASVATVAILLLAGFGWRNSVLERWRFFEKVMSASKSFRALLVPSSAAAVAWLAALVQHLLRVGVLAALATALGLGIPVSTLFALTPAALLVAMVPMSIGGWGVRELTFVYFLGTAGVSAEAALSLSVAFGLLRIFLGAIGGATWALLNEDHFRVDAAA